jgi:hypothetical protein
MQHLLRDSILSRQKAAGCKKRKFKKHNPALWSACLPTYGG